jgi:hypothetical protein
MRYPSYTLPKLCPTADRDVNLRSRVMRNTVGNSALAKLHTLDFAELVCGLLSSYPVDSVTALGIVDEAEVLASLLECDNIHEAGGVGGVGADLAIDLDETLHKNGLDLAGVQGVLQTISKEDDQWQRVAKLVRTGGGFGGIGT